MSEVKRRGSAFIWVPPVIAVVALTAIFGYVIHHNQEIAAADPTASAEPLAQWETDAVPAAADSPVTAYLRSLGVDNVEARFVNLDQQPCALERRLDDASVTGCVMSNTPTTIYLTPAVEGLSPDRMHPLVAHELAHVYQLALDPNFLQANAAVKAAFPGTDKPHEELADCMAFIKTGHTTGVYLQGCTDAQVRVGNEVWAGRVPSS